MLTLGLFIERLVDPSQQLHVVCVAVTVVFSITVHELAHGVAAMWQGDDTPLRTGHMTWNPIVHMGWISVILFVVTGMAFGAMPVNPSRFRSKYGDALVSAAGPASNVLMAFVAMVALGLWVRFGGHWNVDEMPLFSANSQLFLWYFSMTNVALALLNLLPIPPLDGSHILADFSPGYREFTRSARDPRMFMVALVVVFVVLGALDFGFFDVGAYVCLWALNVLSGGGYEFVGV